MALFAPVSVAVDVAAPDKEKEEVGDTVPVKAVLLLARGVEDTDCDTLSVFVTDSDAREL